MKEVVETRGISHTMKCFAALKMDLSCTEVPLISTDVFSLQSKRPKLLRKDFSICNYYDILIVNAGLLLNFNLHYESIEFFGQIMLCIWATEFENMVSY